MPLNSVEAKGERLKMVLEFLEELQDDDEFIPFEYNNQHLLINKSLHVFDKTANIHIASLQDLKLIFH